MSEQEHWIEDEKQRARFWVAVGQHGLDNKDVHRLLNITSLKDFQGGMGDALNAVLRALEKERNEAKTSAVTITGDLYPDEKSRLLAEAVARVAPWAHNKNFPLDAADIALAVQRSVGIGLDPLNPHEVQIWKDGRGLHFQLAYTMLSQWATQILGGHTEPTYTRLTKEELETEGLLTTDIAFYCRFVMKADILLIGTMIEAGWDPLQARTEMTVTGLGTASLADWNGKYFAPNARSKAWKVKKRAYTDAIRTRFGTPGRATIEEMRQLRGEDHITAADWQITAGNAKEQIRLAAMIADDRECEPDPRTPEEVLTEGRALLHGEQEETLI